jgi:hypothetical protein
MAVLQRVRAIGNERFDLPDFLNLDAFANADWAEFVEKVLSTSPVIVSGFDITSPQSLIGTDTTTVSINIANSVMFHPTSTGGAGGFFVASSSEPAQSVTLTANQTNFIEVDQSTSTGAPDTRAIWDESGGADGTGEEFTQTVDTVTNLDASVTVNTTSFTAGRVPIAQVVVNVSGVITGITDSRNLFYRLGSGGASPNPLNAFTFPNTPAGFSRTDTPVTVTSSGGVSPFLGSDKNIPTLKDWMDAMMTRVAELQGSPFWFANGGAIAGGSLSNLWWDSLGSILTTTGTFSWVSATSTFSWDAILTVQSITGPYNFQIPIGSKTVADGEVVYIDLLRNVTIPSGGELTWSNANTFVNGAVGRFAGLVVGDWIKKSSDTWDKYVEIVDFKNAENGGGAGTTAALAVSVNTVQAYNGTSGVEIGHYATGDYAVATVAVAPLISVPADSDTWWLAYRTGTDLYIRD